MRITVTKVVGNEPLEVSFRCASGSGMGVWASEKFEPVVGCDYGVELTVSAAAALSDEARFSISQNGDSIVLNGVVDSVDEDGIVALRLASDCLAMCEGASVQAGDWARIAVSRSGLLIYAHDFHR